LAGGGDMKFWNIYMGRQAQTVGNGIGYIFSL
jgi:hypothetical protein